MPRAGECCVCGISLLCPQWRVCCLLWLGNIVGNQKGILSVFKVHFANRTQWIRPLTLTVWMMCYVSNILESLGVGHRLTVLTGLEKRVAESWWPASVSTTLTINAHFNYLKNQTEQAVTFKVKVRVLARKIYLKDNLIRTFLFLKQNFKSHLFMCVLGCRVAYACLSACVEAETTWGFFHHVGRTDCRHQARQKVLLSAEPSCQPPPGPFAPPGPFTMRNHNEPWKATSPPG